MSLAVFATRVSKITFKQHQPTGPGLESTEDPDWLEL